MMHKADDKLHGSAVINTRWPDIDMCVALAKSLIEVGCRSKLPTRSSSYVRLLSCLAIVDRRTQRLLQRGELLQREFLFRLNPRKSLLYSLHKQSDLLSHHRG